jgi:hypothetical protein
MRVLNPQLVLIGAWQFFWGYRRAWFDLATIPLIWLVLILLFLRPDLSAVMGLDLKDPAAQAVAGRFLGSSILCLAAMIIVWAMFASAWCRFCLGLAPSSSTPTGLSFDSPVRAVAASIIKLFAIHMAISLLVLIFSGTQAQTVIAPSGLSIVALLASAPLLLRSSIITPAAAAGTPLSLGAAWRLTRGNWLRLMIAVGVAAVAAVLCGLFLSLVVGGVAQGLFGAPLSLGPRLVVVLVNALMLLAATAFVLSAVVLCYRQLVGPGLQIVPQERDRA